MSALDPASRAPSSSSRRGRPLLFSNALDAAGRQGMDFATDVLAVVLLGASAAQMGLLNAVGALAFLVLGIPIGVLVDRSPTVRLLAGSGLARAALLATLVAAWALDGLTMIHLYVLAGLIGITTVVTETTQTAIAPRVAGRDAVAGLVARMQSAESVVGLVVPALAGIAVAAIGAGPTLSLAAVVTVLAALVALRLRVGPPAGQPEEGVTPSGTGALATLLVEAKEGWSVLRANTTLWRLTLASMLVNLGLAAHSAIEVVLVLRTLGLGTQTLGLLISLGAMGALVGSVVAVPLVEEFRVEWVLRASMLLLAPIAALTLLALFDTSRATWWLSASAFLWGVSIVVYNVVIAGLTAELTPTRLMGRVFATRRTLAMGVIPGGSLAGGLIADQLGMAYAVLIWIVLNASAALLVVLAPTETATP
ncbi:MAG: MFS transporter [Ornithinimicrobium sp.]|uniref:MFS transporter n=1 Tax=Ornithinimicrobium sp. TaxID=1977084 RepID=UPI0026DECD6C|nr:MFS transporter [Ornithinimicrobium sp.]MDO5740254.1 MFS transporter [Ornithinimicrobium sp.]